jgi:hypothetical protein
MHLGKRGIHCGCQIQINYSLLDSHPDDNTALSEHRWWFSARREDRPDRSMSLSDSHLSVGYWSAF